MAEVETLCDRIAILKDGKIAFIGTIEELTAAVGKQYTVHITTPVGRQSFVTDNLTQTLLEKFSEYKDKKRREGEGKEDDRELLYRSCSHFRNSCRLPVPCPRDCSSGNLKFFQKLSKEHLTIS